ncbi:MAG: hypothetical protein CMI31_09580 [Opitutae bacterium]|nr:hypothetical protein [Opitutae bacterium]
MRKLPSVLLVALLLVGCGADKSDSDSLESNASADAVVDKWAEWEANPAPYGGLKALTKIKEAKKSGATFLDLRSSGLTEVSPPLVLPHLKAWRFERITDLSPLAEMTDLKLLDLRANQISDLSPLKKLKNLEILILLDNKITDVSPLKNLTNLKKLFLDETTLQYDETEILMKALPNCEIRFELIEQIPPPAIRRVRLLGEGEREYWDNVREGEGSLGKD